uniref:AlNc14C48G3847 protein n=1 Tax=Albugo laibachii Nc14 TaxID=890382 RepID=F0WAY6_9STRA|nr:AlNc14C48G3847 [Albugo laibachii Nc14]CCA18419.1 AlNc14C50G3943 [Albugo laibachii Nc14]|eukprot:CCA18419.1 AlNc14C50G3943 [Albugo laibachii Nc14]
MEEVSLHRSSYRALHSETSFFINREKKSQLLDYKCIQDPHTNSASSDWHIRAFLQLEAKLKPSFQQNRAEKCNEGLIVEQILYYRRLFTIEALCSPDFLSIAFTRLAEYFLLRLLNLCSDSNCRQMQIFSDVLAVVMPHSRDLQDWLFDCFSSASHVSKLARHLVTESREKMELIWKSLEAEFLNQTNELDGINVLESMRLIIQSCVAPLNVSFTKTFLKYMQELAKYDARRRIQYAVISNVCAFLDSQIQIDEDVYQMCVDLTQSLFDASARFHFSASYLLESLVKHDLVLRSIHVRSIMQNLELVVNQNITGPRIFIVYTRIHCNLAIVACEGQNLERCPIDLETKWGFSSLQTLVQLLRFDNFEKSWFHIDLWKNVLERLQEVCQQFLHIVAPHVSTHLLDLLEAIIHETCVPVHHREEVKRAIAVFLSHIACFAKARIQKLARSVLLSEFRMIEKEASFSKNTNRYYLALAVIVFGTIEIFNKDDRVVLAEVIHLVETFGKPLLQYYVMREAAHNGFFGSALSLLPRLLETTEHEQHTGFLMMLEKVCLAESSFTATDPATSSESRTVVGLDTLYVLSHALTYLEGSIDTSQKFVFQRRYISLRLQFLQFVQELQQLIGEVELIARIERYQEFEMVATQFDAVGDDYNMLRLSLLGVSEHDLLMLAAHARCAHLFAVILRTLIAPSNHLELSSFLSPTSAKNGEYSSDIAHLPPLLRFCIVLEKTVNGKIQKLNQSISEEDRVSWIVKFFQHFISTFLHRVPCALPRIFFQTQIPKSRIVQGSGQFLTFAEANTFSSKPRVRSQLGVSLGSAFTCFLHGVLSLGSEYSKKIRQREFQKLEINTIVQMIDKEHLVHEKVYSEIQFIRLDTADGWHSKRDARTVCGASRRNRTTSLYKSFESDIYIEAKHLTVKGTYRISSSFVLIDFNGDAWRVPTQAFSRGFIVY